MFEMNRYGALARLARVACLFATALSGVAVKAHAQCGEWEPLGSGTNNSVGYMTVFDDGSGRALYAGGSFTQAGVSTANRIARWDGSSWEPLGSGMNSNVRALTVFDDGSGRALYAAGDFSLAGGIAANRIARWDGSSWSPLGAGMNGIVNALAVFDDGSGPALYAAGWFTQAGGNAANRIARWDGSSWSPLGAGLNGSVEALAVLDKGSGRALYAGGRFTQAGGQTVNYIARWDGSSWSPLGSGMNRIVGALTVFDDGSGPVLYAGGHFTQAGGSPASYIARWDGSSWSALGSGVNDWVFALAGFDDGSGPALYAGGDFTQADGSPANRIARWDGASWSPLGVGVNGPRVSDLMVFDDDSGPVLYASGSFTQAGGSPANRIAAWRDSCGGTAFIDAGRFLRRDPTGTPVDPTTPPDALIDWDAGRMATATSLVVGAACDGVTRLALRAIEEGPGEVRFRLLDETGGTSGVGALGVPGQPPSETSIVVSTQEIDGVHYAFVSYRAPRDFVRSPDDVPLRERTVRVERTFTPSFGDPRPPVVTPLRLTRPPVVLLHGLASDAGTWQWGHRSDTRFTFYEADYRFSNLASFSSNHQNWIVQHAAASGLHLVRREGYAATQADFVGHSMGGILARFHVADPIQNYRSDNLGQGDLNRLITLGSPHAGSGIACLAIRLGEHPVVGDFWRAVAIVSARIDLLAPAIYDLRPPMDPGFTLPAAPVPAHAIAGTGGPAFINQATSSWILPHPTSFLRLLVRLHAHTAGYAHVLGPGSHDLIVAEWSASGDLGASHTTTIGYSSGPPVVSGTHTNLTRAEPVWGTVASLLDASVDGPLFAPGFPQGTFHPIPDVCASDDDPPFELAQNGSIIITSPAPGTVVQAGDIITFSAEPTGDFSPTQIYFASSIGSEVVEGPHFSVDLTVPPQMVGTITISAMGVDDEFLVAMADDVNISAATDAVLIGIELSPNPVVLFDWYPQAGLRVTGIYDDGHPREIREGVAFVSDEPSIATVDADGLVRALREGETTVRAEYQGFQDSTEVIAEGEFCIVDLNGDGVVDADDFFLFLQLFAAGDSRADFNNDGIIDADDFFAFLSAFAAGC